MSDEILSLIDSIADKKAEQQYLLQELRLWREAEIQGIDSSGGGAFGFNPELLNPKQAQERRRFPHRFVEREASGRIRLRRYNYFRYPDDRIVSLNPMLEAPSRER